MEETTNLKMKFDLQGTLKDMEVGEKIEIPFSMQKESTVRHRVFIIGKKYGFKYSVSAYKDRLTSVVTRVN